MIDEAESFVAAADVLKGRGAYKIYILATHGLLSGDAPKRIEESCIDEVCHPWGVCHNIFEINYQEMQL